MRLVGAAVPDAHTAGLIVLLNAVDAVHKVVDGDQKQLRTQANAIVEGEAKWVSEAVGKAVESVRTAVNTAVIAAIAAFRRRQQLAANERESSSYSQPRCSAM